MSEPQTFIVPFCKEAVSILYQDNDLLLVNKPSGLLSVPGRHPDNKDCLISRVQKDYPTARIVHRLDMDTSGIMVIALNADSHRHLNRQFEQRKTEKRYEAIVHGIMEKDEGEIDLPICCDWPNRPLQKIDHEYGKAAQTRFTVLERNKKNNQTRVSLKPITGRSHQLRIHLATIGHPILGCEFYGGEAAKRAERLLLHACELQLTHPSTGLILSGKNPSNF